MNYTEALLHIRCRRAHLRERASRGRDRSKPRRSVQPDPPEDQDAGGVCG